VFAGEGIDMIHEIFIPTGIHDRIRDHLFQSELEQAAFLFASTEVDAGGIRFHVQDCYLVPSAGWDVQMDVYLEMSDEERAKILKMARDRNAAIIDCHSHPHSQEEVWFSPSDLAGITEFGQYVKWKLKGRPFAALVFAEASIDGVVWHGEFAGAEPLSALSIEGQARLRPTGSWFNRPQPIRTNRFSNYE